MKKEAVDNNALILKRNKELRQQYTSPLVKWYQATMTMDEKFKFGMISYQEYAQWKAEHPDEEEGTKIAPKEETNEETEPVNHTFWEDDDGDRENVSSDSYADFLAQNNVNVANKNTVNVDAILSMTEAAANEPVLDEEAATELISDEEASGETEDAPEISADAPEVIEDEHPASDSSNEVAESQPVGEEISDEFSTPQNDSNNGET